MQLFAGGEYKKYKKAQQSGRLENIAPTGFIFMHKFLIMIDTDWILLLIHIKMLAISISNGIVLCKYWSNGNSCYNKIEIM
ncbi:MAG TPA: hypothetical protein DIW07_14830 [Lachnospiraceae bacterium]|jgi:hypothetical protein|nr:hypothetical protein [Lachnospiraceae bacterium]